MTNKVLYQTYIVKNDDIENIKRIIASSSYQSYTNGEHKHTEKYNWVDTSNNKGEYVLNEPVSSIDKKFYVKKYITKENDTYRFYNDIYGFSKLIFWMEKMYRLNGNIQCYDAKDNPIIFNNKEVMDYNPKYEHNFNKINLISDKGLHITKENNSVMLIPSEHNGIQHRVIDTEYGSIYDIIDSDGKLLYYFVSVDTKKLEEFKANLKKDETPIEEIFDNYDESAKNENLKDNPADYITKEEMSFDISSAVANVLRKYITHVKSQKYIDIIIDLVFNFVDGVTEAIYKDKEENFIDKETADINCDEIEEETIIEESSIEEISTENEIGKDKITDETEDEKSAMVKEIIEHLQPIIMNYILSMEDKKKKKKKKNQN